MARVFLLTATPVEAQTPEHMEPVLDLRHAAEIDRIREHALTDDPAAADLILFAESYGSGWHFERVRAHPLTRQFREKCFLYSVNPFVIPFLPGIYTGLDRRWSSRRTVSGFYVGIPENRWRTYTPPASDLPYLYSFTGSPGNAAVRGRIMKLVHPRGYLRDTSHDYARALHGALQGKEMEAYRCRYAEEIRASKFVLCPRGLSVSTIRVFEAMEMGRVPVILADGWLEPPGPDWSRFTIRIAEAQAETIPEVLARREKDAPQMGELARKEWETWFAPEVLFQRAVEYCLLIRERRRLPEGIVRWSAYAQYLRPFHLRRLLRRLFS